MIVAAGKHSNPAMAWFLSGSHCSGCDRHLVPRVRPVALDSRGWCRLPLSSGRLNSNFLAYLYS